MQKQFDNIKKMNLKQACKAIEDMTFNYRNPVTGEQTYVPAKHYEEILSKTVEQFLDQNLKIEMLNNVYKQLEFLKKEYEGDFIKSLICLDMGIKPSDLSAVQTIALDTTYDYVLEQQKQQKRNFHMLGNEYVDKYKNSLTDKELHAEYLRNHFQENTHDEFSKENDFDEPDYDY